MGGLPALWVPFYLLHGDVETRYRGLRRCSLLYMLGSDDWSLINSLMQHAYTRWQASTGGEINLTYLAYMYWYGLHVYMNINIGLLDVLELRLVIHD